MKKKKETGEERFYIGGRAYVPAEAFLLCVHQNGTMLADISGASEELYLTKQGRTFFKVSRGATMNAVEPRVEILSEEAARAFMDQHSGGILTESYDAAFGAPETD
ncbi:MAG: hypothetical protein LUF35_09570 [Lachnospiraceae bacterium]|nr:hypothetical protein [Lachnospiraceae bacterium]